LAGEVSPFNIRVLTVEPGALRTDNIKVALDNISKITNPISDYTPLRNNGEKMLRDRDGNQPGDPTRAAHVIVDVVCGEGQAANKPWPGILVLGSDAVEDIQHTYTSGLLNINDWKMISNSIDIPTCCKYILHFVIVMMNS
jgi:hypothetical protein